MLILENEFVQRFRVCVHLVSLLMVPAVHAAPPKRNNVTELKQLSAGLTDAVNASVKGINPLIPSPKIKPNLNNLSYTGKPTDVMFSFSYSNLRTNAKIGSNYTTQPQIKDSYDTRIIFADKNYSRTDSDLRSPIVNQPKRKGYVSIDNIIERCRKNSVAGAFCEVTDDYPISITDNILKNVTTRMMYGSYFGNDTIEEQGSLQTKNDFGEPSRSLCASQESIKHISTAKNANGDFRLIVQSSEMLQGIRVELCQPEKPICEAVTLPSGYQSQCVQKYMFRKLVAATNSPNNELVPVLDDFRIPSCCACEYKPASVDELLRKKSNNKR